MHSFCNFRAIFMIYPKNASDYPRLSLINMFLFEIPAPLFIHWLQSRERLVVSWGNQWDKASSPATSLHPMDFKRGKLWLTCFELGPSYRRETVLLLQVSCSKWCSQSKHLYIFCSNWQGTTQASHSPGHFYGICCLWCCHIWTLLKHDIALKAFVVGI